MSNEVMIIIPVMTGLRCFLENRGVNPAAVPVSWNYVIYLYFT